MRREIIIKKLVQVIIYQDANYVKRKTTELSKSAHEMRFLRDAENLGIRATSQQQEKQQRNLLA